MFRAVLLCSLLALAAPRRLRQPISAQQERRICAELCRSGLGGEPCGEVCLDLLPQGLPVQSPGNDTEASRTFASRSPVSRSSACPVLCANKLGYPLCSCDEQPTHRVDFHAICDHYCENENWVLRGCPCENSSAKQRGPVAVFQQHGGLTKMAAVGGTWFQAAGAPRVDWDKWCHEMCKIGEGGSACNCDILPFSLNK